MVGVGAALGVMATLLLRPGAGDGEAVQPVAPAPATVIADPRAPVELETPEPLPAVDPEAAREVEQAPPPPPPRGLEDGARPRPLERP